MILNIFWGFCYKLKKCLCFLNLQFTFANIIFFTILIFLSVFAISPKWSSSHIHYYCLLTQQLYQSSISPGIPQPTILLSCYTSWLSYKVLISGLSPTDSTTCNIIINTDNNAINIIVGVSCYWLLAYLQNKDSLHKTCFLSLTHILLISAQIHAKIVDAALSSGLPTIHPSIQKVT